MHFITSSLMVGTFEDAQQPPLFVGAVLFLASECSIVPPVGITYESLPLVEFQEADAQVVRKAVEWLERHEGDRALVCCRAGMGRSVSIVMAYLCCVKGMQYNEAFQLLKTKRPGATPLPNLKQTIEQVRELRRRSPNHQITKSSDKSKDA